MLIKTIRSERTVNELETPPITERQPVEGRELQGPVCLQASLDCKTHSQQEETMSMTTTCWDTGSVPEGLGSGLASQHPKAKWHQKGVQMCTFI